MSVHNEDNESFIDDGEEEEKCDLEDLTLSKDEKKDSIFPHTGRLDTN